MSFEKTLEKMVKHFTKEANVGMPTGMPSELHVTPRDFAKTGLFYEGDYVTVIDGFGDIVRLSVKISHDLRSHKMKLVSFVNVAEVSVTYDDREFDVDKTISKD